MKFENKYKVDVNDLGVENKMTNYAMLGYFEDVGGMHSASIGYGINDVETTKRTWLIMDWKLKVIDRPKYGEEITVKTWARQTKKHLFYTYRDFEMFVGNKKVAVATSKWILFDTEEKKIAKITDEIFDSYKPENEGVFEETELLKLKEVEGKLELEYLVRRFDIDVNRHMHNLNYLRIAYESLPEEEYFKEEKKNIRIMYKHQILLGEKVNCYYLNKEGKDIVTIKNKDNTVLHAIIELY